MVEYQKEREKKMIEMEYRIDSDAAGSYVWCRYPQKDWSFLTQFFGYNHRKEAEKFVSYMSGKSQD